ncbi:ankyrin repeat-containing domain protein [Mycena olivaceomarginata]|nr:ankyrin repeat-containing domain protein [Mycena olivaceomarginata]
MKKRQDNTQELQHKGTGSWFLDGNQFKGWKEKPGSLWIRGDSGTGKSVLSSIVIQQLFSQRQHGTAIAYFYFDFRDEKSQRMKIMLQSIILQLSAQSPNSYSVLEREFESSQGQTLPTYNKLLGILEELLSDFAHTYIVLDALDECNEHQVLVQLITRLRDRTTQSLHLLFTSQPREIFMEAFKHAPLIVLTPDITHKDIQRFINSELLTLSHLTRRMRAEEIVAKVVKKSNGMFRLAALLLIELRDAFNPDLNTILSSFPDSLFGVYSRFLQRIHPTAEVYVSAVLRWLSFSCWQVTVAYLEDALTFDFSSPLEFVYDPTRRGENADRLFKMLEGMIVVNETRWDRVVSLAHASVKDYLQSERFTQEYTLYDLRAGPSHRFLAQTCLSYLLQFTDHPLIRETRTNYLLGPYAAQYWYYHLHRSDNPALLSSLVVCLLQDGSSQYAAFNNLTQDRFSVTKPLSVCSQLGYTEAVRFLLQNGADPNTNDNGSTALRAASSHGHLDIVCILLQSGAKVDILALDGARYYTRWYIVQVLLQKSSISVVGKWISDELAIAVRGGRMGIVQILLEAWTNLGGAQFPLHHLMVTASEQGGSHIVRLLLKHGANVNATAEEYNALGAALLHDRVDTVRVLLEQGAEVNATSGIYGSPLQVASRWGDIETVRLLVEHGAEVNATSGIYGSALQVASRWGDIETVQLLVEHGAEVNATSGIYGTALQVASRWGDIETVQLLVEHGAEVNTAGGEYGSPLQAASRGGNVEMVQLLLEKGAQVNTAGGRYGSALQAASIRGPVGSAQLLLKHGADVNATGGMHGSALQAASRNGHVEIVRLLLEKDADVNAFGGSALKAAARLGRLHPNKFWEVEQITCILLEHGAHEEDMMYGSEEDVDTDDEGAILDSSLDDSSSSESDD